MFDLFVILRGIVYASAFILLWTWLAVWLRTLDSRLTVAPPAWLRFPGGLLALAGASLAAWCVAVFVTRGRGTPAPFDPPLDFVAIGPYRYVRNPMYIGGFGALLGAGLVLESLSIVILALVFLLVMHLVVVLYEEPTLSSRFGQKYHRYKATVRRWLPGREGQDVDGRMT